MQSKECQPGKMPPQVNGNSSQTEPKPLSQLPQADRAVQMMSAPTLTPPQADVNSGITAWMEDGRVDAVWSINQNRNSWVAIRDVGWKKFADNSDSAIVAFTILAAHARQVQTSYTVREEADSKIHECYVW